MKLAQRFYGVAVGLCCFVVLPVFGRNKTIKAPRVGRTLEKGESGSIALSFSSDGKTLAGGDFFSGKRGETVLLWDLKTSRIKKVIEMPKKGYEVWSLAFFPDGKTLVTAAGDFNPGRIDLWDVQTGKLKRTFTNVSSSNELQTNAPIWAVAVSPFGNMIAAETRIEYENGSGGEVLLLDTHSGKTIRKLRVPNEGVQALDFSVDGRMIAVGSDYGCVRICSTQTGKV